MFINDITVINEFRKDRSMTESYLNAYSNQAALKNGKATPDYVAYMTKSLINRGILYSNSEAIDKLYKATFEEMFTTDFKNLFLYASDRDITGVYEDIVSVKNMNAVGVYDLISSMIGAIPAKYYPTFQLGDIDISSIDLTTKNISLEVIKEIISSREDYEAPEVTVNYNLLDPATRALGPQEGITYYKLDEETNEYEEITEFASSDDNLFQYFMVQNVYVKEVNDPTNNYTLDDLTDDEKDKLRAEYLGQYIDTLFFVYSRRVLVELKELFSKYSIWELTSSINFEADKYQTSVCQSIYCNMLNLITIMVYVVNLSDKITDEMSNVRKMINDHVKNVLSKQTKVSDMVSEGKFFSNTIVESLLPTDIKEHLFGRYKFISPVEDNVEDTFSNSITIQEATMSFTENLIKFRSMLDYCDLSSISNDLALIMNFIVMNLFNQSVYMSAYYSRTKTPLVVSVDTLMKRFTPSYDKIISLEALEKFVNLSEV